MVKRVGVYWNTGKAHGLDTARALMRMARDVGMEPVPDAALAAALGLCGGLPLYELAGACDVIIVLGGDGTLLSAAGQAARAAPGPPRSVCRPRYPGSAGPGRCLLYTS